MFGRTGPKTLMCVVLLGVVSLGHVGRAGEVDPESRVEALERRVKELTQALDERDAEIERLKGLLARREGGEEEEDAAEAHGADPWPFGNDLDEWLERFQRRGFGWGLPGRRLDPLRRPYSIPLPGGPRVFLGVELEDLASGGVRVAYVVPRSPAEKAGIQQGDELAEVDGRKVSSAGDVVAIVRAKEPGEEMPLAVLRDGQRIELEAKLGERSDPRWRGMPRAPSSPWAPGRPGSSLQKDAQAGGAAGSLEVEVEVPGGTARVSLSAPGLYLTEDIARELDLDEDEREKVEAALAAARGGLAKAVSEFVAERGGSIDAAAISDRRLEGERSAREALAGVLTREQLERLELLQAKLASNSRVSITIQKGAPDGLGEGTRPAPRPRTGPRAEPRGEEPAEPGNGREF